MVSKEKRLVVVKGGITRKFCLIGIAAGVCLALGGCVAQQADVVKIQRDLNRKIAELDRSKKSLQQAVREANQALEEANAIIAKQRGEIKALLQARAELDDQMATLKEGDLSEVRGAIEENRHQLNALSHQIEGLHQQVQQARVEAKARAEAIQPTVNQLQDRISKQHDVVTTQAEKTTEFRASLLDFQQALTTLRENMVKQERVVQQANYDIERISRKQLTDNQSTTDNFKEVKRSINSVVSALEKVSKTLADRLDEQDQKLVQLTSRLGSAPLSSSGPMGIKPSGQATEISRSVSQLRQELDRLAVNMEPQANSRDTAIDIYPSTQSAGQLPGDSFTGQPSYVAGIPSARERKGGEQRRHSPDEEMAEYQQHYALLGEGDVVGALNGFSQFLQQYPTSPLAANAQYWVGECYYSQRQFAQAILEFERVASQYPSSEKVPAALLKIGYSNLELENPAAARAMFRQIVRSYPKSPEAAKAYARLTEFDQMPESSS